MTRGMANTSSLSRVIADARHILELAVPLALTQLAQVAISTSSIIVLGLLGSAELAAGGLAIGLFNLLRTMGVGLAVGTANLVAEEARSAGDAVRIANYAAASLQISTLAGLAAMAIMTQAEKLLLLFGQDASVAGSAGIYLLVTSWGILPCLWFNALRSFTVGLRKPGPVLAITVASTALNAMLAYGLAIGRFGLPQLGAPGVALAAALVHLASFAALSLHLLRSPEYGASRLLPALLRIDTQAWKRTLALGLPTSAAYGSEAAFTVAIALLMGTFGQAALAAHNIANQVIYIAFMLAIGLSHGTSVAISEAQGLGQTRLKRRYGAVGISIGLALMTVIGLIYILVPQMVLSIFGTGPGTTETMRIATQLLAIAALLQLFDCSQNIGVGLMRGLGRARLTLGLTLIGYWLVGFPVAVALSYPFGPAGVWWGLCAGLAATALLILSSFERLTRA